MVPLTPVTETVSVLPSRLTDQQHRPPFSQGQLLQGTIIAKEGAHQFALEINGQKLAAHTSTDLQVGQKLNLQVSSLVPQLEFQIVANDPITPQLGARLPLLGQQSQLASNLSNLAANAELMQSLGSTSQETLRLYANNQFESASSQIALQAPQLSDGETAIVQPQTASSIPVQQERLQATSELFRQVAENPTISTSTAQLAADLATLFTQAAGKGETPSTLSFLNLTALSDRTAIDELLGALLSKVQQNPAWNPAAIATLLSVINDGDTLPAAERLQYLLTIPAPQKPEQNLFPSQERGLQLAEQLNRLGLDMERLLLEGKTEEAARTLKFSLLETAQRGGAAEQNSVNVERLVQNLELHQLLQLRLAGESLFFLPLPFSFLQQGFLIIDREQSGGRQENDQEQNRPPVRTAALHLQLAGLGHLQIDIHQSEEQIHLKFQTEDIEQAKYLAEFREELASWLTSGTLVAAQFFVGAKEPVKTLLARVLGEDSGVIDTSA